MPRPTAGPGRHPVRGVLAPLLACLAVLAVPNRLGQEPAVLPAPVRAEAAAASAPPAHAPLPPQSAELDELELRRGDTLLALLGRAGVAADEAHAAVVRLREVADLRRLPVGQRLGVAFDEAQDGAAPQLARLVLPLDAATEVHLVRAEAGGFAATSVGRALRTETVAVAAAIEDSFYGAGRAAGLPHALLAEMIRLLSWDVDFQRGIQPGDRLEAVFRRRHNEDGQAVDAGELDFVGLVTGSRAIEAYRFAPPGGAAAEYYDREGRPLRKWLLRTPVDGARLSSRFGPRRHPILGYTRLHRGIDFAAPTGTPIIAAAAGVVESAGRNRGYGNYLRLRHNREYSTAYAHLSRFAPRVRPGRRVEQGEVVGYVGATGLATGPHLHYELLRHGRHVNPLGVEVAGTDPLAGQALRRFTARRDEIDRLRRGGDTGAPAAVAADGGPPGARPPPSAEPL